MLFLAYLVLFRVFGKYIDLLIYILSVTEEENIAEELGCGMRTPLGVIV